MPWPSRWARRAIALDAADAEARSALAVVLLYAGDPEGMRAEAEMALAMSPNLAMAHGMLGVALTSSGKPREGIASLETCLRLDPHAPTVPVRLAQTAMAYYFCGDYEAVIEAATRAIRDFPDFPNPYRWLAAALGQLGRREEGAQALAKHIELAPAALDMYVRNRPPFWQPEDYAHVIEGLRKAGWEG